MNREDGKRAFYESLDRALTRQIEAIRLRKINRQVREDYIRRHGITPFKRPDRD